MTLGDAFPRTLAGARSHMDWAWAAIYRDLAPVITAYFRGRGVRDPDDLTAEVFVGIVRDLANFDGDERAFRTWALTIAHRRLIDSWRRDERDRSYPVPPDAVPTQVKGGDTEEEAMARVGSGAAATLLSTLTPEQQTVVLLRVVADLTVEEIARILGKRPGAVKALQRRALRALGAKISS